MPSRLMAVPRKKNQEDLGPFNSMLDFYNVVTWGCCDNSWEFGKFVKDSDAKEIRVSAWLLSCFLTDWLLFWENILFFRRSSLQTNWNSLPICKEAGGKFRGKLLEGRIPSSVILEWMMMETGNLKDYFGSSFCTNFWGLWGLLLGF